LIQRTRSERLLQWHAENGQENILFTDEKIFTIEEKYNLQNSKIYAQTSHEVKENVPRVQGGHQHSYFMICWEVSHQGGDTSSFLQERGETGFRDYQEDVLQGVVKHLNMTLFSGQEWVFQQDSVPDQKAETIQEWLRGNLQAFISAENWLSGSADLKPLDNNLWAVLADMACQKRHNSLEGMRRSLVKAAAEIPLETERAATAECPECLKVSVEA
jgi:hypothetical protein